MDPERLREPAPSLVKLPIPEMGVEIVDPAKAVSKVPAPFRVIAPAPETSAPLAPAINLPPLIFNASVAFFRKTPAAYAEVPPVAAPTVAVLMETPLPRFSAELVPMT